MQCEKIMDIIHNAYLLSGGRHCGSALHGLSHLLHITPAYFFSGRNKPQQEHLSHYKPVRRRGGGEGRQHAYDEKGRAEELKAEDQQNLSRLKVIRRTFHAENLPGRKIQPQHIRSWQNLVLHQ